MITAWNRKYEKEKNNIKPYYCLYMNEIYLIEDYKYINMSCQINVLEWNRQDYKKINKLSQTRKFKFEFDENNEDWNVKLQMTSGESNLIIIPLN